MNLLITFGIVLFLAFVSGIICICGKIIYLGFKGMIDSKKRIKFLKDRGIIE